MTNPIDELLPCPFCGGGAAGMRIDRPLPNGMTDTLYRIVCNTRECGASTVEWYPKASAAKAWNRRREWRAREMSDEELVTLYASAASGMRHLAGLRAVERAVRERSS